MRSLAPLGLILAGAAAMSDDKDDVNKDTHTEHTIPTTVSQAVQVILQGQGYVMVPDVLSKEEVEEVKRQLELAGGSEIHPGELRSWLLLTKGKFWWSLADMRCALLRQVCEEILGPGYHLGSMASNTLLPGHPGGPIHVDYPFKFGRRHLQPWSPEKLAASDDPPVEPLRPREVQTILMLDDFTVDNGGTYVVPYSQLTGQYPPGNDDEFYEQAVQITGKAGSLFISTGSIWHATAPNTSRRPRAAVLGQYLSADTPPMKDVPAVREAFAQDPSMPSPVCQSFAQLIRMENS